MRPGYRIEGVERAAGLAGLVLLALAGAVSIWLSGPPRPLPVAAAAERFAAGRALGDVAQLARAPRPVGSAAHRAAREYLLGRMAALGLEPEVQEATVVRRRGEGRLRGARVRNLVGRLAGRGGGGAVLLVAHYDSRPNTPGAGDDASGVAVVLEAVRALAAGPPLARDLIVLLTDAEELGLLGAHGFVAAHPWLEKVELVLNFEGRGSRGPAVMFETGHGDLGLVRAFARAAPRPLASSLSAEVYARMPNDTDFTAFRGRGLSGLNFAFLGGLAAYHTALDRPERLDPASLQHAGAGAVGLIRHLDGCAPPRRGADGVWFNPLGGWLLVLPAWAALGAAGLLAALTLALAVHAVGRGRLDGAGIRGGVLLALLTLVLAPLSGATLWRLFADMAPALLDTPHSLPHRLELTGVALFCAGLATAAGLAGLTLRLRPTAAALGVAVVLAVLALVAAALVPGAGFLLWWPLWGLLATAAIVLVREPPPGLAVLLLSAGALPGVVLLAPLAVLVLQALTLRLALAALAPAALVLLLALPALVAAAGRRLGVSLAAFALCLATLAAAFWGGADARRPRRGDLVELADLDTGVAFRLSRDERPHPWVHERLGAEPQAWQAPSYLGSAQQPVLRGAPRPATASGPQAVTVEDLRLGGRRLTVRLSSPAGAPMLWVEASSTVEIQAVELAGERFERGAEEAGEPLRLELAGLPPEGLEVTFELPGRWPVELHLTELFYGLGEVGPAARGPVPEHPAAEGPPAEAGAEALPAVPGLPPELIPSSSWSSFSRLVHRSFLL